MRALQALKQWLRPAPTLEAGAARPARESSPAIPRRRGVSAAATAKMAASAKTPPRDPFKPYTPPPGVVPEGDPVLKKPAENPAMAMDYSLDMGGLDMARMQASYALEEGQAFEGFPRLAILAQRGEFRLIADVIATEMTSKWIKFKSLSGKDDEKAERIKGINDEFERLDVKTRFREATEHDCYFGRSHIFLDLGETEESVELSTSIGTGAKNDPATRLKITPGSLKALRVVEPMWVYPQNYNSTNPLSPTWYKPSSWYVMGKAVHATRLLTFVGREVPDILKPAYAFAGLSMTQMAMPYVFNWLDVRTATTEAIKSFTTWVLKTSTADLMDGGNGDQLLQRLEFFNVTRKTQGTLAIDKDAEDFANVAAPLSTLDNLQAQALEHIPSIARIPLVKYTGISPSGLNATSEFEMDCFEDFILAFQEKFYRPNLTTLQRFVQLSLDGAVDEDIGFEFVRINELTEQEKAELRRTEAETGKVLIESKAISAKEERERIAGDIDGPYADLDPAVTPEFPMTELEKADYASKVATAVTSMADANLIPPEKAGAEFMLQAYKTGIGLSITQTDLDEIAANPPAPGGAMGPDGMPMPGGPDAAGGAPPFGAKPGAPAEPKPPAGPGEPGAVHPPATTKGIPPEA